MNTKRSLYFALFILCALLFACTRSEDRAVWVVRFDLKTEQNVKKIVRDAKAAGFNIILAQVYGRGDAYYNSAFVPRAEILEDQPR